jgi:hypothetical protein
VHVDAIRSFTQTSILYLSMLHSFDQVKLLIDLYFLLKCWADNCEERDVMVSTLFQELRKREFVEAEAEKRCRPKVRGYARARAEPAGHKCSTRRRAHRRPGVLK